MFVVQTILNYLFIFLPHLTASANNLSNLFSFQSSMRRPISFRTSFDALIIGSLGNKTRLITRNLSEVKSAVVERSFSSCVRRSTYFLPISIRQITESFWQPYPFPLSFVFDNNFIPHWRYWLLSSNAKRYFTSDLVLVSSWPSSELNYERFEELVHIADSVPRFIPHEKLFQIKLKLANQIGRTDFAQLKNLHIFSISIFSFSKKCSIWIKG